MKTIRSIAAQGDLLVVRVDEIPRDAEIVAAAKGRHIVAHSETGHHHTVAARGARYYAARGDAMTAYLEVTGHHVELRHHRPHDTHETLRIPRGRWMLRRQREYTPQGWRRVED